MILVTGAAGLVGSFTVDELKRRGRDVRIFRRPEFDLSDPDSLVRAIQGTSGIVHAACTVTDTAVDIAAMETLLANWKVGPFVYISTLDVYGYVGSGTGTHLIEEDTPPGETMNEYSRAKVVCERLLIDAAARAGRRDYVILRAPYIWGPHPTARKRLVRARLEEGKPIVLPGVEPSEWMQYRDAWIDVRDFAWVIVECVARPAGGPLNVLAGHFAWHDLYSELIRWTGSESSIVHKPFEAITEEELPDKRLYVQTWHFSDARLEHHLGKIPRFPFAATVRDTVLGKGPQ